MQRVKASSGQLKCLIDFMKLNKECAAGGRGNGLHDKIHLEKQWQRLVETLNGLRGPVKSVDKWKQTWRDVRNSMRKKAMKNKKENRLDNPSSIGNASRHTNNLETRNGKHIETALLMPPEQKCKEIYIPAESNETICDSDLQCKPKVIFKKLVKAKLNITVLRRQLILEELKEKKLRNQILEDETKHKKDLCELEKQEMLLKIEILKTELENKRKQRFS